MRYSQSTPCVRAGNTKVDSLLILYGGRKNGLLAARTGLGSEQDTLAPPSLDFGPWLVFLS